MSNLKIITNNILGNGSTVTASSSAVTGTSLAYLYHDKKSYCYKSGSTTSVNFIVTFSGYKSIGAVVLPFCNLTASATIRVRLYTGTAPTHSGTEAVPTITATGTTVYDSGTVLACPWSSSNVWSPNAAVSGINTYAFGGGTYARCFMPNTTCSSMSIEIIDSSQPSSYLEFSKMIVGEWWSPVYNTGFGMQAGHKISSSNQRVEAGDLVTTRGTMSRTLMFDLKYMIDTDRDTLLGIIRSHAVNKSIYVNLFPDDDDPGKEYTYQIYGKLTQLNSIQHSIFTIYASQVELEEI